MRPASMSALSRFAISPRRSDESPTSSGLARGKGSPFSATEAAAFAIVFTVFDMVWAKAGEQESAAAVAAASIRIVMVASLARSVAALRQEATRLQAVVSAMGDSGLTRNRSAHFSWREQYLFARRRQVRHRERRPRFRRLLWRIQHPGAEPVIKILAAAFALR